MACSEVKDYLLVSWQLMKGVLVWVVSSGSAVEGWLSFLSRTRVWVSLLDRIDGSCSFYLGDI